MVNQTPRSELSHGICLEIYNGNSKVHGCVRGILTSWLEVKKKGGVTEEIITRCNYSVMQLMLVVLWILGTWVQDSLGVNTTQLANQFGRD